MNIEEVDSVAEANEKKAQELKKVAKKSNKDERLKGKPQGKNDTRGQNGKPLDEMGGNMNDPEEK